MVPTAQLGAGAAVALVSYIARRFGSSSTSTPWVETSKVYVDRSYSSYRSPTDRHLHAYAGNPWRRVGADES